MKSHEGQRYITNLFRQGLVTDVNTSLPTEEVREYFVANNFFNLFHESINTLSAGQGIIGLGGASIGTSGLYFIGAVYYDTHVYHFWRKTGIVYIYREYDLIGQNAAYPGSNGAYLYMDVDHATGDIAITDNTKVPIVLNLDTMYAQMATTTYTTDYDSELYEINAKIELTQPAFKSLSTVGSGGGLQPGSYSYSYRLVNNFGDKTPWSPPTPFIPVPVGYGRVTPSGPANVNPGARWYGSEASLEPTRYGITLAIRVNNFVGMDFVEIRRQANNEGGPVDYTVPAEFYTLGDSIEASYNVIEFTDSSALTWAPLDDSYDVQSSAIATCRSLRFTGGRLVLADVVYQSRIIDDDSIFLDIVTGKQGIPIKKNLGVQGYFDMDNQVYNKSTRLGEKYSYGIRCNDKSGNKAFVVPIPDLKNFQFPERREAIPASEQAYSPSTVDIPTVASNQGPGNTDKTYEVFLQGDYEKVPDTDLLVDVKNIIRGAFAYKPFTPTNREGGSQGLTYGGYNLPPTVSIGPTPLQNDPEIFGPEIMATGMKLGGIDVSALPDWVEGFSVVRSEAAGRVVAQGLGMYSLTEAGGTGGSSKALDKLWTYFPELDGTIGDKSNLYDDIKANPENYKLQLVAPVGFTSEVYNALDKGTTEHGKIDFASYANFYYGGGGGIIPYDSDADIGEGDGYITFGKWRNTNVGTGVAGVSSPYEYIFDIDAAQDVQIDGKNGRMSYLEIDLGANVYYTAAMGLNNLEHADSKAAHEPWYIVNIIREGVVVPDAGYVYKEIGHHIPINSTIGEGSGEASQSFDIVGERIGDVLSSSFSSIDDSTYRYVWVDDKPWLDITGADLVTTVGPLLVPTAADYAAGTVSFNGVTIYGVYEVRRNKVIFNQVSTTDASNIVPADGAEIQIRYNENEKIDVFLGDTVIAETGFTPIDCLTTEWDGSANAKAEHFKMFSPMPYYLFYMDPRVYRPDDPTDAVITDRYQNAATVLNLQYVRQWMVNFICESTINIPMLYKDFWPHMNYVMRPNVYDTIAESETVEEYLDSLNIYEQYNIDYPDEHLNWGYGGFKTPQGYNFDYNKKFSSIYSALPEAGVNEVLSYPRRVHWSNAKPYSLLGAQESLRLFLPTNVYDLKGHTEAVEIGILYDAYSEKGDNLYAITNKGVVLLITQNQLLRDGISDELGVILSDANYISGELWIDRKAGVPSQYTFSRGRAEGTIRTKNNIDIPILTFFGNDRIYMLSGNTVVDLTTNVRKNIKSSLGAVSTYLPLSMAINHRTNSLEVLMNKKWFTYSFDVNNWSKAITLTNDDVKFLLAADKFETIYDRIVILDYDSTNTIKIRHTDDDVVTTLLDAPAPSVETIVTPGLDIYEFIDLYIKASEKPSSVVISELGRTNTLTLSDTDAGFKSLEDDLYYVRIGRGSAGKFVAQQIKVQINFDIADLDSDSYVSYIKTGIREINN